MAFEARPLDIADVILVTAPRIEDSRGYFMETYRLSDFAALGMAAAFVQDNQSMSAQRGTIRGLHYQRPPRAQAKLVRVLKGAIFDVVVDLRRGSNSYGRWTGATLTAKGGEQLFMPRGFAHGYCTLEPDTEVAYRSDDYYSPGDEGGIHFADPAIGIDWPVSAGEAVLSDKDRSLPFLGDLATPFISECPS